MSRSEAAARKLCAHIIVRAASRAARTRADTMTDVAALMHRYPIFRGMTQSKRRDVRLGALSLLAGKLIPRRGGFVFVSDEIRDIMIKETNDFFTKRRSACRGRKL